MFKPYIAEYVNDGEIWSDPSTGKLIELCPWLRKETDSKVYTCAIYFDRPEDCRYYPSTIAEMIRDECEMIKRVMLRALKKRKVIWIGLWWIVDRH